ncbi:MAG: PAS domain S-box protein [Actinomycetota bacterium]
MVRVYENSGGGQRVQPQVTALLIGASESNCIAYTSYLQADRERQYEVFTAATWAEGIQRWRSQSFDVALLDLSEPTGLGFLEWLQEQNTGQFPAPKLPVAVLIDAHQEDLAEQALQLGAMDYLVKPSIAPLVLRKSMSVVLAYQDLVKQLTQIQPQQDDLAERQESDTPVSITQPVVLEKENARLQFQDDILQDIYDAVISTHPNGIIETWNHRAEELFGYTATEAIGQSIALIYETPEELTDRVILPLLVQGRHEVEVACRHKNGHLIYVNLRLSVIFDEQGKILRLLGVSHDITAHKQLELALQTSEAKLSQILNNANAAIISIKLFADRTWQYDFCSAGCETVFGYTPAEMMSGIWWSRILPEDRESVLVPAQEAVFAGRSVPRLVEYRFQHKDGSLRWISGKLSSSWDAQNNCWGVIAVEADITDRKQIENALLVSQTKYYSLFDSIDEGFILCDVIFDEQDRPVDLFYLDANAAALRLLAQNPIGRRATEIGMNIAVEWIETLGAVARTGEAVRMELPSPIFNTWFEFYAFRTDDTNNQRIGLIYKDIGERKQAEFELQQRESLLRLFVLNAPVGIAMLDRQMRYLMMSQRWLDDYHPGSAASLIGRSHYDVMPHIPESFKEVHQRCLAGATETGEANSLGAKGNPMWTTWKVSPWHTVTGEIGGIIIFYEDITQRKQAELALQELNQSLEQRVAERTAELQNLSDRLSLALEAGQIGTWDWDLVSEVSWDAQMYQIYGLQALDRPATYQDWLACVHTDEIARVEALLQAAIQGTADYNIEFRIHRPDGAWRWIYAIAKVQCNDEGKAIRMIGINQDITDRKQVEQALQKQAERERLTLEITQRIRQSLELQTIFDIACAEIRWMLAADRVGIFKFYPESDFDDGEFVAESVVDGYRSVLAIHIHDHCFGENDTILYTQRKYLVVDDIYNHGLQTCQIEILAKFQIRAYLVLPLFCGDDLWGLLCVHQCQDSRHWQRDEIELTCQLANQLAIAIQQSNLFDRLQEELTQRQQAEALLTERNQQLAISNQELARATRLKDEFLANMSHELRTPLNAIMGMAEGLQDQMFGSVTKQQIKALQTIERTANHLLLLINDILDVAKVEAGRIDLEYSTVAIRYLCESSLAFVKQQALRKRIQLTTQISTHFSTVFVDERRIRQVLINLLNNAVKFTPEGGCITLSVFTVSLLPDTEIEGMKSSQSNHKAIQFAVIDTGIGISKENLPKLFQPFMQIDSALNRQFDGTGLGLTLVKRLVELHGGTVSVTSEVGVGSCFSFIVPLANNSITTPEPSDRDGENFDQTPLSDPTAPAPLILLAEDNEANIMSLSSYLEAKGYRLLVAKNGETAIALAQSKLPDLILMDIQMPGIDGFEAMRRIRADEQLATIPIIALTALAMSGDRERCLAAGANDYLSKPIKLKQLLLTLQNLLKLCTTEIGERSL